MLAAALAAAGVALGAQERPPTTVLPLDLAWSTDLGAAPSHAPAYGGEAAYVPLRDGTLASVSLSDGTILWCVVQPVDWPPAAAGSSVVVAHDRSLTALAAGDGRVVWSVAADAPVSAPPVWRSGWLVAGFENGDVVAVRAADGRELWRRRLGAVLRASASIAGSRLYLPLDDGRIVVLRLATGETIWTRAVGGSPRDVLALDAVFVGSTDNFFYRLALEDGAVDWRWRTGGDIVGAPRIDPERVYFVSLDNVVRALDRRSGVQRWRRPLPLRPSSGPILVGPALAVAGVSPQVRLFDPLTGRSTGTYTAPGELGARPHLVPGLPATGTRLVVPIADGRILGLAGGAGPSRGTLGFPPPPLLPLPVRVALDEVLPVDAPPLAPPPRPPVTEPADTAPDAGSAAAPAPAAEPDEAAPPAEPGPSGG